MLKYHNSKWLTYWDCVEVEPYLVSKLCSYKFIEAEEVCGENALKLFKDKIKVCYSIS